jgi:hypothetical protein
MRPEYNRCRPYREMLTYKPLTDNAVQELQLIKFLPKNKTSNQSNSNIRNVHNNNEAIYRGYKVNVCGVQVRPGNL